MNRKGLLFAAGGIIVILIIIILSMRSCKSSPEALRNANANLKNQIQTLTAENERLIRLNQNYENQLRTAQRQNDSGDAQRDRLRQQNANIQRNIPQTEYERLQRENLQNQILIARLRAQNRQMQPGPGAQNNQQYINTINQLQQRNNNAQRDNNRLTNENRQLAQQITALRNQNAQLRGTPAQQTPAQNQETNNEIARLTRENQLLQQVNTELKRQIELTRGNNQQTPPQRTDNTEQLRRDNEQFRNQLTALRQENERLQQQNNASRQDAERARQRGELIQQEVNRLQQENAQLKQQAGGTNVDTLTREIERLKRENANSQQIIVQLRQENARLQQGNQTGQQAPGQQTPANDQQQYELNILKELVTRLENQNRTLKAENERLKQQGENNQREVVLLRQENERIRQQPAPARPQGTDPEVNRLRTENERLNREYNALKLQRNQERQQQPTTPAVGGPAPSDNENQAMRLENNRLKQQIDKLNAEIERLKQQPAAPAAGTSREEVVRATHITNEKIKFLENEILDLRYQNQRLQLAAEANNTRAQKITELERQLALANDELRSLREKLKQLESQRSTVVQQAQQNNTTPDTRNLDNQIEQLRAEIARRTNENRAYQEEIARLKKELESQRVAYTQMIEKLRSEIQRGTIRTTVEGDKIRMIFLNEVLFNTGAVTVSADGARILRIVGDALKNLQYGTVYIEGHTDNEKVARQTVQNLYYQTNWEYSVVRATRIARYMIANFNIPPQKIVAAGRSEYMPRDSNATPRGKALNRRIELLITPEIIVEPNRNRLYSGNSSRTTSAPAAGTQNNPPTINSGETPRQ